MALARGSSPLVPDPRVSSLVRRARRMPHWLNYNVCVLDNAIWNNVISRWKGFGSNARNERH